MESNSSRKMKDPDQQGVPETQYKDIQDDTDVDMIDPGEWSPLKPTHVGLSKTALIAANVDTMGLSAHTTSATIPGDGKENLLEWEKSVSNALDEAESVSRAERSIQQHLKDMLLAEQQRRQHTEDELLAERRHRLVAEDLLRAERHRRRKAEDLLRDEQRWREEDEIYLQNEEWRRETAENSLQEERRLREAVENELKEKSTEILETQKRWKQAARELNKMRSHLRYSIQTFAIQYYGGEPPKFPWGIEAHNNFVQLLGSVANLAADLQSPEGRANAIQAILWRSLASGVFDQFRWLHEDVGGSASKLCEILRPKWQGVEDYTGSRDTDTERKFQIWNPSTTALLAELVHNSPQQPRGSAPSVENAEDTDVFRAAWKFFKQIPTSSDPRGLKQGLRQIFQEAIAFDEEINMQVARIEWEFGIDRTPLKFDPQCMTATKEQERSATTDDVRLVIAPRMIKRGKSTGTDFGVENQLLPMEVSLMPAPESSVGGLSSLTSWLYRN